MSTPKHTSIDLALDRLIILQGSKNEFKFVTRRATEEDWFAFFDAIVISSVRDGKDSVIQNDFDTPNLVIAERLLVDVAGYKTDSDSDLKSLRNWQALIPYAHRMALGRILASTRVTPLDGEEGTIFTTGQRFSVSTTWTASAKSDAMVQVSGLIHKLSTPTEAQHRRFAREDSRTRILGGSRAGTTIYPFTHRILAELYDELVMEVEGYTLNGVPLDSMTKEAIAREMDTHHKVMVAQAIFKPNDTVISKLDVKAEETTEE